MKPGSFILLVAATMGLSVGGCGPIKMPRFPKAIKTPAARVADVKLVATGEQASRYDVLVVLDNPNDVALPLDSASYRFSMDGLDYRSQILPNVVLPRKGSVGFHLPAVLSGPDAAQGGPYDASATITYTPPGELRRVLYDLGLPKPKVKLQATGSAGQAAAR